MDTVRHIRNGIAALACAMLIASCAVIASAHAQTLEDLHQGYQLAVANYEQVLGEQEKNTREIARKEAEVRETKAQLEQAQEKAGEGAVALYKIHDNQNDMLSFVLGSESLTEAIMRYDSYERVEAYYRETIDQARQKKAELEEEVVQLEERKLEIAQELEGARETMEAAEQALRDADHSDGAKYHQLQGNDCNCGATSFIVGVNVLLHENKYPDNVKVWSGPGFNGDSTVNLAQKCTVWLEENGLSDEISVYCPLGDITTTEQLRDELNQGHVVIISSGAGSAWQRADGTVAAPGSFPDGHWIVFYYYADGIYYANDSSVAAKQGAGCPYNEEQMKQWLSGRSTHFATVLRKV